MRTTLETRKSEINLQVSHPTISRIKKHTRGKPKSSLSSALQIIQLALPREQTYQVKGTDVAAAIKKARRLILRLICNFCRYVCQITVIASA